MANIRIKDKSFKLYIPEEDIKKAIARIAKEIRADIEGKDVLFVCEAGRSASSTAPC